eukprot:scaffold12314_cov48-Isochrysis_galbana.AAC.1
MPWIRVTDAFEKAMPACVAAAIRVSRAAAPPAVSATIRAAAPPVVSAPARACGLAAGGRAAAHAARRAGGMARMAEMAWRSAKAFALRETNASSAWQRASRP